MAPNSKIDLNAVFKDLRKQGFIARQNFSCCSSCGGYEIATDITKMIDEGKKTKEQIKGCVFYHKQDGADMREGRSFMLRYGEVDTQKHGVIGLSTKECGEIVTATLSRHNIQFEWDGDPNTCITIKPVCDHFFRPTRHRW